MAGLLPSGNYLTTYIRKSAMSVLNPSAAKIARPV
jgi:hypothetical protein